MKLKSAESITLLLFIAYCVDLIWKIEAGWREIIAGDWKMIGLALTVRFAYMGFLLAAFLRLRKSRQKATQSL